MNEGSPATWEEAVQWLLAQPDCAQVVHDCYYDQPTRAAAERYCGSLEWNAVLDLIPAYASVAIDVGSGQGITAVALARAGLSVTAVEPDPSDLVGRGAILRASNELGLAIRIKPGTAEAIPAANESCDLVLARQVLHHASDLPAACREIFRVLRPRGIFIALRDHVVSGPDQLPTFFDSHPLHRLYGGENAFRLEEYRSALRGAGFKILQTLRSFDSVINYAPHTRDSLRSEIQRRASRFPLAARVLSSITRFEPTFDLLLAAMSRFDNRPGRLVSFICRKPTGPSYV